MKHPYHLCTISRRLVVTLCALGLPLGLAGLVLAETELPELLPSDPQQNAHFGTAAAVDRDVAVFGAPDAESAQGAAYVYEREDGAWSFKAKLTATSPSAGFVFGAAVAVSGDTILVGAWKDDGYRGAVYVFTRDAAGAWTQQQRLRAADGTNNHRFGLSVAVAGGMAVIGAPGNGQDGSFAGAAYVFTRDATGTWTERQRLLATDAAAEESFGNAVALSGGTVVVGAPGSPARATTSGSAYVFTRDAVGTWTEREKLTTTDAVGIDRFGGTVAVSGATVVVGAVNLGNAYVFARQPDGTWPLQERLHGADTVANDSFGSAVAVSGDTVLVGATRDDDGAPDSGSVYLYKRGGDGHWTEQRKLHAADPASGDLLGWAMAMSRDTAVVGSLAHDHGTSDSGSAYAYTLETDFGRSVELSGKERLRIKGMAKVDGNGARSLTLADGLWTLTGGAGPDTCGAYVALDETGEKFELTLDEGAVPALVAALVPPKSGKGRWQGLTAELRGTPRISLRLNRRHTKMILTATVPVTGSQRRIVEGEVEGEGKVRSRRGAYKLRLSAPYSDGK